MRLKKVVRHANTEVAAYPLPSRSFGICSQDSRSSPTYLHVLDEVSIRNEENMAMQPSYEAEDPSGRFGDWEDRMGRRERSTLSWRQAWHSDLHEHLGRKKPRAQFRGPKSQFNSGVSNSVPWATQSEVTAGWITAQGSRVPIHTGPFSFAQQ
ncbi:hypothetical protein TruAng_006056 [Truncatella angustata]|nr:hypothetical protein TruAng_006056 [Truncatella angustata]